MKKLKHQDKNFNIELRYYADGSIMIWSYNKFTFKRTCQHIPKELVKELFVLGGISE